MLRDSTVRARVNSHLKHDAEIIFAHLGISMTEAINIFLAQVKIQKGMPFEVKIPNKKTLAAFEEIESGKNVKKYKSVEELFKALKRK